MVSYSIDIQYPISIDGSDNMLLTDQFSTGVLHQFEMFRWWQYRTLQLQVAGSSTSFTVSALETGQTMRFTLLENAKGEQIELLLESDIVVLIPKKDVFGLVTRKIKDYITFERLSLNTAKAYLELFVSNNIEALQEEYKNKKLNLVV